MNKFTILTSQCDFTRAHSVGQSKTQKPFQTENMKSLPENVVVELVVTSH